MNLGRVDRVDVDGLLRLAASIRAHFGDGEPETAGSGEAGLAAGAGPMEVVDARLRKHPPFSPASHTATSTPERSRPRSTANSHHWFGTAARSAGRGRRSSMPPTGSRLRA